MARTTIDPESTGVIHAVCREELGLDETGTARQIQGIGAMVSRILHESHVNAVTTLQAAHALAQALAAVNSRASS